MVLADLERKFPGSVVIDPITDAVSLVGWSLEQFNDPKNDKNPADGVEGIASSVCLPGMTPTQFCKRLNGVNVQQVTAFLEEHNWLYDDRPESRRPAWRVKAYVRDLYLTERRHLVEHDDIDSFDAYTPVLLRKGAVWIYRQYLKGVLPMKKSWNGEFTHDKELAGAA